MICAICLSPIGALAQGGKWEPPVPSELFKDGKTEGKNPQPTHRLPSTDCDDCQKLVDQLQAALDDWYVMQLEDAKNIKIDHSDMSSEGTAKQQAKQKQIDEAMAGLGQPNAKDLKAQQEKQKKDAKDKKGTHGSKDALAKEIKRLAEALQKCLKQCEPTPTPTEETTATPTPEGPEAEKPPELPKPIKLPSPPPCFDTEADREAFIDKWEKVFSEQNDLARRSRVNANGKQNNKQDPWYIYYSKSAEIYQKSADDLRKIIDDAADKSKTPVPCPKKTTTGGGGKTPTPTPTKGKPKKAPRVATGGGNISLPQETFCELIADNKIDIDVTGTGETIGHVADARVTNFTDEVIAFAIPPAVLESRIGKNQNYGCPRTTDVALQPHESKKIPLDGVCLNRNKPPVGKGVGGDLAFNDCDPDRRISRDDSDRMLRISESVYEAADELEDDGHLKEIPYKDPEKRKDIVKQWATWVRMSEITGDPPPTKDDLRKVVEKQVGKVPPDQQKKIDQGINTIFEKIELTTEKAKDLEKEGANELGEPASPGAKSFEISDETGENETPTPQPGTQEKKKKKEKEKQKKEKYPPPIQAWLDVFHAELAAETKMMEKRIEYKDALRKWGVEHNQHYKELKDALEKAKQKIGDAYKNGMPTKQDVEDRIKAQSELDKFEQEVAKDFQKTGSGKAYFQEFVDAEDALKRAKAATDEAGKNIEPEVKNEILNKEEDEILKKKD